MTKVRKPIELHIHDKKKHMGKEEIEERADAEVVMGDLNFSTPPEIKKDAVAMRKWREVTKIYTEAGLTLVSSTDNGVIGRYCELYSEYITLLAHRSRMSNAKFPADDMVEIMAMTEEEYGRARAKRLWGLLDYYTSLDGLLRIDTAINAKAKAILVIEDRIFLNPASKVRTLPIRRKEKEKSAAEAAGFDV